MTTEEKVTRVVAAVVSEASKEKRGEKEQWGLKLKVPFSDYPIPTSMPLSYAAEVFKGESYMVKLRRGRLVKDDSDGSRDFHYFWDVAEWNTQAEATPASAASNGDDRFRTKEEMRWTEAMHMATRMMLGSGGKAEIIRGDLREWAEYLYETLSNPPTPEMAGEEPDTIGAPEEEPPRRGQGKDSTSNGARPKRGTKCGEHEKTLDREGKHPVFDAEGAFIEWCKPEGG